MTNGSQVICAAAVYLAWDFSLPGGCPVVRDNDLMDDGAPNPQLDWSRARLRKHADYQRVYKAGRKQFSPSMSYFVRLRAADELTPPYAGPRVGLTAGRVLGNAVERNRIKRRMREAARVNLTLLPRFADVVLHPRKLVLDMEFSWLEREVAKVFSSVSVKLGKGQPCEKGQRV
ncbi:MAG: ribonuclease P protein component [Silvibacterium sp.]